MHGENLLSFSRLILQLAEMHAKKYWNVFSHVCMHLKEAVVLWLMRPFMVSERERQTAIICSYHFMTLFSTPLKTSFILHSSRFLVGKWVAIFYRISEKLAKVEPLSLFTVGLALKMKRCFFVTLKEFFRPLLANFHLNHGEKSREISVVCRNARDAVVMKMTSH
jgi:hypothetical protein